MAESRVQGTFTNANQLAQVLHGTGPINLLHGLGAGNDVHILFLYNDANNNAHLADVDFLAGTKTANTALLTEHVSDMAELVGVNANSLVGANIHFVA